MPPVVLLLLLLASPAFACTCLSHEKGRACQLYHNYGVSFSGRVVDRFTGPGSGFARLEIYRFEVHEVFKGLPVGLRYVFVDPGSFTSCMNGFGINRKYLVYAAGPKFDAAVMMRSRVGNWTKRVSPFPPAWKGIELAPLLWLPICNPTRELQPFDPDLTYLRSAAFIKKGEPGWVEGRAIQNLQPFDRLSDSAPVPDATIALESKSRPKRTVRTAADGTIRVSSIQPGTYSINFQSPSFGTGVARAPTIQVPSGGCAVVNPSFESRAVVSGSVVDARGRPVVGVRVDARLLGTPGAPNRVSVNSAPTDSSGRFRLDPFPASDAVIGVNLGQAATKDSPWDSTYLPGAQDPRRARVFRLAPGEKVSGVLLHLPPDHHFAPVDVSVFWPDGSAASNATVWATQEGAFAEYRHAPKGTNRVRLHLVPGRRYSIHAESMEYADGALRHARLAIPVDVVASAIRQRIRVTLPPAQLLY